MICGKCKSWAASVATVKACHAGERAPCAWVVPAGHDEDGPVYAECGAHVTFTDRGWSCEAGHEHVTMEARHSEGWDYAEEYGEAMALAGAGVEPVTMSGHAVLGPQSFGPG